MNSCLNTGCLKKEEIKYIDLILHLKVFLFSQHDKLDAQK